MHTRVANHNCKKKCQQIEEKLQLFGGRNCNRPEKLHQVAEGLAFSGALLQISLHSANWWHIFIICQFTFREVA